MKKNLTFLFLIICLSQTNVLSAQASDANFSIDPGVVNKINQNELKQLNIQKNNIENQNKVEETITSPKQESYTSESGVVVNPSFELKGIKFSGNTIFSDKELNKYIQNLVGKTIYISDVFNAVNDINKLYYTSGYFTSFAYVPPQKITDNIIEVNIVESKIGTIEVEGNKYSKVSYLKNNILATNGLKEGQIFNAYNIRRSLNNINEKDYMKGQISVEEGAKQNLTDIKLRVAERYPLSFNVAWDNGGNSLVGRQRNIMLLSQNNLFGLGHSIYGGTILANGTTGVMAGYKMPIGKYGTELQFDYSFANVNLKEDQTANRINGRAKTFSLRAVQPIFSNNKYEIKTDLGMDLTTVTSSQDSTNTTISDYKLAVARHGINFKEYDNKGVFVSRYETSFGVPILGATQDDYGYFDHSDTAPKSNFLKFKLDLTRLQKLPKECYGIFRVTSQYSPNNLYPTEQILLGGVGSIRGFEPGNCTADLGVNGTFELRSPVPGLKKILPKKLEGFDKNVKLGYFYDWGAFSQQHTGVQINGVSNFLQSVGTGIHVNVTKNLVASVEIAMPIGSSDYRAQDCMLHFSIRADLWDLFSKKPNVTPL